MSVVLNTEISEEAELYVLNLYRTASEDGSVQPDLARLLYGRFPTDEANYFNFAFPQDYDLDDDLPHFYVGNLRVVVVEDEYVPLVEGKKMIMAPCGTKIDFV